MFYPKCTLTTTYKHFHVQKNETNSNYEFLWPYPAAAANTLLEIGMAVISAVVTNNHLSPINTSCVWNSDADWLVVASFITILSGNVLLNASQQQQMTLMQSNFQEQSHILLENTPCSHLHSFCATGMSSDLLTTATMTWVSLESLWVCYMGATLLLISFLYWST